MKNKINLSYLAFFLTAFCILEFFIFIHEKPHINSFMLKNPREVKTFYLPYSSSVLFNFFYSSKSTLTTSTLINVYEGSIFNITENMDTKTKRITIEKNGNRKQFLLTPDNSHEVSVIDNFGNNIPFGSLTKNDNVTIKETANLYEKNAAANYLIIKSL